MALFRRIDLITSPSIFTSPFLLEEHDNNSLVDLLFPDNHHLVHTHHRFSLLSSLSDRVSALELAFDRLLLARPITSRHVAAAARERRCTWESEVADRRYKVVAETTRCGKTTYKWTAQVKDETGDVARSYSFKAVRGGGGGEERESGSGSGKREKEKEEEKREKEKKKKRGDGIGKRVVQIEEVVPDHGALVLRQAFAKRDRCRGKRKELSPQDAAMMIQMTFKAYLIRRSQSLRALRELAVAKAKLKELRVLFNNFSYRRRVTRDAEERQRFTERIIVVLLTVDSIEGADVMVRAAKRSMTDELEAMLDVVDPQPLGKARFAKRRTFDMPDGIIQKELAAGVAEVVQMLDQENGTFEACL